MADGNMFKISEKHHQKCFDYNNDVYLVLWYITSMFIGTGIPSPATLLFNRLIRGLFSQMNSEPLNINAEDTHIEAFKVGQHKYIKDSDTKIHFPYFMLSTV